MFRISIRRAPVATLIALPLAFSASLALAGDPGAVDAAAHPLCAERGDGVECLVAVIDHLSQVKLDRPVKTLLIGNPAIADVNMLNDEHAVVTARAVGSTNIIFLDAANEAIAQYDVYVREGDSRRVMLRRGPTDVALFQCTPFCERALSQNDSPELFNEQNAKVRATAALATAAAAESE